MTLGSVERRSWQRPPFPRRGRDPPKRMIPSRGAIRTAHQRSGRHSEAPNNRATLRAPSAPIPACYEERRARAAEVRPSVLSRPADSMPARNHGVLRCGRARWSGDSRRRCGIDPSRRAPRALRDGCRRRDRRRCLGRDAPATRSRSNPRTGPRSDGLLAQRRTRLFVSRGTDPCHECWSARGVCPRRSHRDDPLAYAMARNAAVLMWDGLRGTTRILSPPSQGETSLRLSPTVRGLRPVSTVPPGLAARGSGG